MDPKSVGKAQQEQGTVITGAPDLGDLQNLSRWRSIVLVSTPKLTPSWPEFFLDSSTTPAVPPPEMTPLLPVDSPWLLTLNEVVRPLAIVLLVKAF